MATGNTLATVTIHKRNYQSQLVWQYTGEIVDRGDTWMCIRARFDRPESNLGFVVFSQGDLFIEWFFSDRWYNIFQVHEGDGGRIKGWYCNITRPAVFSQGLIAADDLELDVWVMPNGAILLLDEKEFSELNLNSEERMATLRAVESIRRAVVEREAPFDKVRPEAT